MSASSLAQIRIPSQKIKMKEQTKYQIQPEILEFMRKSSGMTEDEVFTPQRLLRFPRCLMTTG